MTYLYNKDVNILNGGTVVSTSNRFPVDATGTFSPEVTPSGFSAFGEPLGLTLTPVIQLDAIYGVGTDLIQTYTSGTGSAASSDHNTYYVSCGTSQYGYGVLRSKRFARYRPGQGALARFTAMFTAGVAGTTQRAGLFSQEQALQFGYDGTKFGIMRATGGKAQIVVLTINTAPTGSQTCTVTLNGTAFSVNVTSGSTTQAAVEIARHAGGYTGWLVEQIDNTVIFLADALGPRTSTYSLAYVSGPGTQIAGTFVTRQVGVAQTETWIYQYDWNIDCLGQPNPTTGIMGPNPSGMTLDTTKLNVFQINYRWLGVGQITFAVEDQATGNMIFVHKIHYTNQNTVPHLANPSFKIGYVAYSTGGTTNVTVRGASMMAAIEGEIKQNQLSCSYSRVVTSNITQNEMTHLMTVYNPLVTNGKAGAVDSAYIANTKELILKDISAAVKSTDPSLIYVFVDPTAFTGTHSYSSLPRNIGVVSTATGLLDQTTDPVVCRFALGVNSDAQFDLSEYRLTIPPGSYASICIISSATIGTTNLALVWSED